MINSQCQAYAVIAMRNLVRDGIIKADAHEACEAISQELRYLFDIVEEEEAEMKAAKILQGRG